MVATSPARNPIHAAMPISTTTAVDRGVAKDWGGHPVGGAGHRGDRRAFHVQRLQGALVLVVLVPREPPRLRLGHAAEVRAVAVERGDLTALGDLHFTQRRARRNRPGLVGLV